MSDYEELKRLAEAATPGEWHEWGECGSEIYPSPSGMRLAIAHNNKDGKFIAAANPAAVLALIAENEQLKSDLKYTRKALDEAMTANEWLRDENADLCKIATELRRWASCEHVHHEKREQHGCYEPCKVLARIDKALSNEGCE